MSLDLNTQVQYLKGVGPKLGLLLEKKGILTIRDLIEYYPRTYEDRRLAEGIDKLKEGVVSVIRAKVEKVIPIQMGFKSGCFITVSDSTGLLTCRFYRAPFKGYFQRFHRGDTLRVIGKLQIVKGKNEMIHPDLLIQGQLDPLQDQLVPIYPETEGLTSARISKLITLALAQIESKTLERFEPSFANSNQLISRYEALMFIHHPDPSRSEDVFLRRTEAHRRLIFEEFYWLCLELRARRSRVASEKTTAYTTSKENRVLLIKLDKLTSRLPFKMTGAQDRVFSEIKQDLAKESPMLRLIQGDVGSGKSLILFLSALVVCSGQTDQCALMAPTEILAGQLFEGAKNILEPLGLRIGFLSGSLSEKIKMETISKLSRGEIDFVIGTHALLEEPVHFSNLRLVIVDEQHRFGVEQRNHLRSKGQSPHLLAATATPIPRTLALTLWGDLSISVLDEMPEGRIAVQTRVTSESKREDVMKFIFSHVKEGKQTYIVLPLVDASPDLIVKDAESYFANAEKKWPEYKWGLIHGKIKSEAKQKVMERFKSGEIQILISTTVIEVGVDVQNANIILIENAERFGISQLHQLRGRVGRGLTKSYCILMAADGLAEESAKRLNYIETCADGFKLADFDLAQRGPGEFLGTKQSGGIPELKMADLSLDLELLLNVRRALNMDTTRIMKL